jgi:hypothetical protein
MQATVNFCHGLAVGANLAVDAVIAGPVKEHAEPNSDFECAGAGIAQCLSGYFVRHLIHP